MKVKLAILLPLLLLFYTNSGAAITFAPYPDTNGFRSDTIDILKYTLNIDMTDLTTDTLRGRTDINFVPKMNGRKTISLDLLRFKIDSVLMNNTQLTYSYNDTLLVINLPAVKNIGDTSDVIVCYHGVPTTEIGGVGGLYNQPPFSYNMGEAIVANPHTYGRGWYPCFDIFRERAKYVFNITTSGGNIGYSNGYLVKDTTIAGNRTRTWVIDSTLPAYLASVDVAPYVQVNDKYIGSDTIPILFAAIAADTAKMKASFIHLKNAIGIYQNCFGKYPWNKVGYSEVGPNGGSMEHASNIAYPQPLINGFTDFEYVFAHELSHHWFGDLVTTWAANDMWLNEGFATYNEFIFEEYLYGEPTYHGWVRSNHEQVLHLAHIDDGHHFLALTPMPSPYTFGTTTYDKGGDIVATLRGYLGDSLFFKGLRYYLGTHKYQPVTTDTLRNSLERYTGMNLTDFFNGWVKAPGFPQFSIDSFTSVPSGPNFKVTLYIKQKLDNAPAYYNNVPLTATLKSSVATNNTQLITASGANTTVILTVPFKPVFAGLNLDEKISEAIAPDTLLANTSGTYSMYNSRFFITITAINNPAFLCFEHNYAPPDKVKDILLHYTISPYRYWKFSGIFPSVFKATAQLYYDGTKSVTYLNGVETAYLDTALTVFTDDSIILLYRPNTATDWTEFPKYSKHKVSLDYGYMQLDSVPPGEYAFANGVSHVLGIAEAKIPEMVLKAFPNPASNDVSVSFSAVMNEGEQLKVYDIQGKLIHEFGLENGQTSLVFSTENLRSGVYVISLFDSRHELAHQQLVVKH